MRRCPDQACATPLTRARGRSAHRWGAWALLFALGGLSPLPVLAETLSWRQASVAAGAGADGRSLLRRGVVIYGDGQVATMTVRLTPQGPPVDGLLPVGNELEYRFEDGSSLSLRSLVQSRLGPDGRALRGENRNDGQVVSGTGRYQGASGSFRMRVRTDVDPRSDGVLGDYFGVGEAEFTLVR